MTDYPLILNLNVGGVNSCSS